MKPRQIKIGITLPLAFLALAALVALIFQAGCQAVGMVPVLGTPTSSEKKIPAEYNLAGNKDRKILVLVDQPTYLHTHPNFRFFQTDAINKSLQQDVKIPSSLLIDYDTLADFRSATIDFSLLSPERVGSDLGAVLVLHVVVTDYVSSLIGEGGLLSGSLSAQASLIDVATGEKLWPALEPAKIVHVGFESERRGPDVVAIHLASDAAHCITRYLYNCPKNHFKISDETTEVGW